jgi:hypothetical protein
VDGEIAGRQSVFLPAMSARQNHLAPLVPPA